MSLSSISLPKPKNWQDFENKTRELFACVLDDPNTQQNGRSGQQQNGVDVYGYRRNGCLVGVQCKKKFEKQVTDEELRSEVEKAKNFKPKIDEFILITTAPRDQKIQETARIITEELAHTDHPIRVSVWGWDDVEEHAAMHEKAWKAFDPTWNPFVEAGYEKIIIEMQELKQSMNKLTQGTMPSSYPPGGVNLNGNDENTPLHGQITAFQRFIEDGHVQAALQQLQKLKGDVWANANRSERYRILVGIASAKLKLGEQAEAATLLIDAFNECPEHKNARKNLATGYLLKNDPVEAAKLAREMLAEDNGNDTVAGILIQALISDATCNDPLNHVPEALYDKEEILVAHVHFQRCRGNPDWVKLAKTAAEKHPDSRLLKLFSAEAVLDELIRTDRDAVVGGIPKSINFDEFSDAVETLYAEARDALDKGYALLPSTAHNTALALRFSNDITKAKEILDASIKQYPNDENLRLQRALIAYSENDPVGALAVLPDKPSDPEAISLLADALADTGREEDALSLIIDIDESRLPEHVIKNFLSVRIRTYVTHNEKQLAVDTINQRVATNPENLSLRALQIRTYRMIGDDKGAKQAFEKALAAVSDQTSLQSRLQLSFEARKLGRDDAIIDLLKGRVASDRESEGLHTLIAASINSGFWVTARETLDSISQNLKGKAWFQRAEAILALNTGEATADGKIARYLRQCPNDLEMILARIGIWQREGRDIDIRSFLQRLNLLDMCGRPEQRIRLAALICHYEEGSRGLEYAYSVLMDNWDNPQVHLVYQGLIFLNDGIGAAMPSTDVIAENTVVGLLTEGGERRYRIEKEKHVFFEDERVSPESDLAVLLIGKQPGEKFKLQDHISSKPVEVCWIKPVYLYALHRSLEQFNERFPRADGLQRFNFDPDAPDPMEDMRAIIKTRAEADQRILEEYRSKGIPLSFAAALIGKDPLDAWSGLPAVDVRFQVCRGTLAERDNALQTIRRHEKKGCVLDAITLSVVRRLCVEKAVAAVCGTIHTSQSVIDLLVSRSMEARQNVGKKQGFLAWHEERLVFEEYTEETMKNVADERENEASWARSVAIIAPSMPKNDFSPDVRSIIDMVGHTVCDPAVVADGNDLLLISEDMGFRVWSAATFKIPTTWLQPVLISARNEGHLTVDEYCEAINLLALSGHTYISLDPDCLMHQARKGDFFATKELSRLLETVGGASADLQTNSSVLSIFIDMLWQECSNELKVKRIVSEVFNTFTKGRHEDQRQIIWLILKQIRIKKKLMSEHALSWLIGHSFGIPYFNDLLNTKKNIENRLQFCRQ